MSALVDRALDALDDLAEVPLMELLFGVSRPSYSVQGDERHFASIQNLADQLGCSDSTARRVVQSLICAGLAEGLHVVGKNGVRRILVTAEVP